MRQDSDDSDEDVDDDDEDELEVEEPKKKKAKPAAKATPKKPAAASEDSEDDEPIGKMKQPKITRDLLEEKIKDLQKTETFEQLSLRRIREKLGEDMGMDLTEHKSTIKEIVTELLHEE